MAKRVARRAHVGDEGGVAVAFTFNNLATSLIVGAIVDVLKYVPVVGSYIDLAVSVLTFYFHRIVLVPTKACMCFATGRSTYLARC